MVINIPNKLDGEIMKNKSIADVAEYAGVSVTTVSRVLNKKGYISDEMYKKIYEAMDALDYQPNQIARSLTGKKTNTVAFLLPFVSYPFFSQLAEKVEMALYQKGYKMILCNTVGTKNRELDYLKMLRAHKVDGLILGNHELHYEEYMKVSFPIVALDINLGENIPVVTSDHRKGGQLAAKKFIENGCKKVVQIKGMGKENTYTKLRHDEMEKHLKANNVECITIYQRSADISFATNKHNKIISEIFLEHGDMDGFFAVDVIAAKVLRHALEKGVAVPEDLKIISYDGTMITGLIYPQLTCIQQFPEDIAYNLVEVLDKMILQKNDYNKFTECKVQLVDGDTTL